MNGKNRIINTSSDLSVSGITNEQVIAAATNDVRYDDAVYPEGYDHTLKQGDDGYIEPIYRIEKQIDQAVLDRFNIII